MASNRSTTSLDHDMKKKLVPSSASPALSTATILSSTSKFINYNPDAKNETSSVNVYIPPVLNSIIMDYLAGDIGTEESKTEKASSSVDKSRLTIFGRNCYELMAQKAATLILWGEENDANEVITLLKNNPALLDYVVEVTDPRGRSIKQRVFEIAFMAGDVDLKEGITEEKEKGLVERITIACGVSQARIDEAKQVLLSPEAIKENAKKNQRIMEAVKKFGEVVIKLQPNEEENDVMALDRINAYQLRLKSGIDQYKADLKSAQSGVIHCGYIFDPSILIMTDQWFKDNVARLDGWYSLQTYVFDVNGYGTLQGELSSRDAQLTKSGIGNLANKGMVPTRSLKNTDGSSYFYNLESALGVDFIIGYWGDGSAGGKSGVGYVREVLENLCQSKTAALQKLRSIEFSSYRVVAQ